MTTKYAFSCEKVSKLEAKAIEDFNQGVKLLQNCGGFQEKLAEAEATVKDYRERLAMVEKEGVCASCMNHRCVESPEYRTLVEGVRQRLDAVEDGLELEALKAIRTLIDREVKG